MSTRRAKCNMIHPKQNIESSNSLSILKLKINVSSLNIWCSDKVAISSALDFLIHAHTAVFSWHGWCVYFVLTISISFFSGTRNLLPFFSLFLCLSWAKIISFSKVKWLRNCHQLQFCMIGGAMTRFMNILSSLAALAVTRQHQKLKKKENKFHYYIFDDNGVCSS